MCFPALWMLLEPTAAVIFSHKHGTSMSLATFDRDSYKVMDHSFSWTGCALTQNDASVKSKLVLVGDLQLKCGIRQKSNTYADKTSIRRGEECPVANLTNLIRLCSQRNVLAMGQSVLYLGCVNANKKNDFDSHRTLFAHAVVVTVPFALRALAPGNVITLCPFPVWKVPLRRQKLNTHCFLWTIAPTDHL